MRNRMFLWFLAVSLVTVPLAVAQDAVKADPKHYHVMSENDQVRILHIHYGPHEKSVMHSHPSSVAVFLTDGQVKFTFPDGKTQDASGKAGEARYAAATAHNPENFGDKPFEAIVVELKGKAAAARPAVKAAPAKK